MVDRAPNGIIRETGGETFMPRVLAVLVLSALLVGEASAAPITYTFSTDPLRSGPGPAGPSSTTFNLSGGVTAADVAATGSLNAILAGASLTGTFIYDTAIPTTGVLAGRGSNYPGSFTLVSATLVGGSLPAADRRITDTRGQTVVGDNETCSACAPSDLLQLHAEPGNRFNLGLINIDDTLGLMLGQQAYEVFNLRLFWIESQAVPNTIPDFLNSNALPSQLPTFNGRLALDLIKVPDPLSTANPTQSIMFFDNLRVAAVPEPGTLALFSLAVAAVGVSRRRRGAPKN